MRKEKGVVTEVVEIESPKIEKVKVGKLTLSFNREDMDALVHKINEVIERLNA